MQTYIGIRVLAPRDANSFIRSYCDFGDSEFDQFRKIGRSPEF